MAIQREDPFLPFARGKKLDLHKYIVGNLQPTAEFNTRCNKAVDALATFLKEKSTLSFDQIFKGGSLGKGTAIRDNCDLDLVPAINGYANIMDYISALPSNLDTIQSEVRGWKTDDFKVFVDNTHEKYSLQLYLIDKNDNKLKVDIVPTFANRGDPKTIHNEMLEQTPEVRKYYRSHFSQQQVKLIKELPPKVKDLIRLVKDFSKTHVCHVSTNTTERIPTSYSYELIVHHYWQEAGCPVNFSMKQAIKAILDLLAHPDRINVTTKDAIVTRTGNRPLIVDPANPFDDVAARFKWDGTLMVKANTSLSTLVLVDVVVQPDWTC